MLDFSNESEQREERNYGPVPGGSIVIVKMTVIEPNDQYKAHGLPFVKVAQSGLYQIYAQFEVTAGEYQGVQWRQNITLPASMQNIALGPRQEIACRIGGAMIKAMLLAANRPPRIESFGQMSNMSFPVKVKISNMAYEKDGRKYWRNEIARVITPDNPEYAQVKKEREIINHDGPVVGESDAVWQGNGNSNAPADPFSSFPSPAHAEMVETDNVPF